MTLPIALLLASVLAAEHQPFHGWLRSRAGLPVAGARVQVVGHPVSAVADGEGRFSLEAPPAPPFELLVSTSDGVAMQPVRIEALPAEGEVEIRVEPIAGESVTVVSTAAADIELPPGAAFSIASRAELAQRAPAQLHDVLAAVPGAGRSGSGLAAVPSLRGLAQGRTLILLDEGRVTAERRAGPSATFVDPSSLEEVEVLRGPGSVAYGSDAFGGVLRMRTRVPPPGDAVRARVDLGASDGTGERAGSAEVSASALGGGFLVGFTRRTLDDYESPAGEVPSSGGEARGVRLGYQRPLLDGVARLVWRTDIATDVGKPEAQPASSRTTYPEETAHRLSLQYERGPFSGWSRLSVAGSWDSYRLITERERFPTSSRPREITRGDVEAQDWGLRVEAERSLPGARLVVGLDAGGRFDLRAINDTTIGSTSSREVPITNAHREDIGLFAGVSRRIGDIGLSAGVRADHVGNATSGGYFGKRASSDTALSGFAAVTAHLGPGLEASLQAARGFRDPLLSDRYYRGVTGRGFITGNPDLQPETSRQVDAALRFSRGRFRLALYGYLYRIDDLVERIRSGDDYVFRNSGEAELSGIELETGLELGRGTLLQLGFQAPRGELRADGAPTADVPPHGGFAGLRRRGPRWSWWLQASVWRRDDRPGPDEAIVPGHATVDGSLAWRLTPSVELQLVGRNLLDRAYPASADARAPLAPGRTLRLGITATWSAGR